MCYKIKKSGRQKEGTVMSKNAKEIVMEEMKLELKVTIIENRLREMELQQKSFQKETDEKFNKIFQYFGIQNEEN